LAFIVTHVLLLRKILIVETKTTLVIHWGAGDTLVHNGLALIGSHAHAHLLGQEGQGWCQICQSLYTNLSWLSLVAGEVILKERIEFQLNELVVYKADGVSNTCNLVEQAEFSLVMPNLIQFSPQFVERVNYVMHNLFVLQSSAKFVI
jgi:hypothetical protein